MDFDYFRKQLPGASDMEVLKTVQKTYLPDASLQEVAAATGYKPASGQLTQGFKRAFDELPGLAAGVGAYAMDLAGDDKTKNELLGYAARKQEEQQVLHGQDASSFTDMWDGKVPFSDWLANSAGYVAGQALQSVLTAGVGAVGARLAASSGAKAVAQQAAQQAIARTTTEMVAKGATTEEASALALKAGEAASREALQAALAKAGTRGAVGGAFAQNEGMELGSIYPDAVEQANKEGRALDGGDLARVGLSSLAAAGVDTAAEAVTGSKLLKGTEGAGFGGRLARELPMGMAREAGTEAAQTAIEHYGAGQPIADDKGIKDIIDSAAIGAVGGGLGGGLAATHAQKPVQAPGAAPVDGLTSAADKLQQATDVYLSGTDPVAAVAPVLAAGSVDDAIAMAEVASGSMTELLTEKRDALANKPAEARARVAQELGLPPPAAGDTRTPEQIMADAAAQRAGATYAVQGQLEGSFPRPPVNDPAVMAGEAQTDAAQAGILQMEQTAEAQAQRLAARQQPTVSQDLVAQRLQAASSEGDQQALVRAMQIRDRGQAIGAQIAPDLAAGDQTRFRRAYENVAQRGGVASPAEAAVLDRMSPNERLYDRIENRPPALKAATIATTLPSAQQQAYADVRNEYAGRRAGLIDAAPEGSSQPVVVAPGPAAPRATAEQRLQGATQSVNNDRSDARMDDLAAQRQAQQTQLDQTNAQAAAQVPAAPDANSVIAAYKTTPALRTAEQVAVLNNAEATMPAGDLQLLEQRGPGEAQGAQEVLDRVSEVKGAAHTIVDPATLKDHSVAGKGELSRQGYKIVKQVARIFGKKLVVYASEKANAADGFISDRDPSTIYINKNAEKPHLVVFGHELMHTLARDNPAAFEAIRKVVKLKDGADIANLPGVKGDTEELISDIQGNRFADEKFWGDVFREVLAQHAGEEGKKAVTRLAATAMRAVNKLMKALGRPAGFDADNYVENLGEVRDAIRSALATYAKDRYAEAKKLDAQERAQAPAVQAEPAASPQSDTAQKSVTTDERVARAGRAARQQMGERFSEKRDDEQRRPEPTRDGSRRDQSAGPAPLPGAPRIEGATGPDPRLVSVAEQYARDNGIPFVRQAEYVKVDEDRARRLAQAYDEMPHAPNDPEVKAAYEDLIRQTKAQYDALVKAGYKFWFIDPKRDPYKSPWDAMRDLRASKTMGVFPTEAGFGNTVTGNDTSGNPLEARVPGLLWHYGSPTGPRRPVTANDLFRAVHDAFGHGLEGAGFRAQGEENAWQAHARLFTGPALRALTTETRGQNSWLNYGPYGEQNRTAKVEDTVFADQKTGLLPRWASEEGLAPDIRESAPRGRPGNTDPTTETPAFKKWFGDSQITNEDGTPKVMYHGTAQDIAVFEPKQAKAIFVTDDPEFAEGFAANSEFWMLQRDLAHAAQNIVPVYVKAENPFDYQNRAHVLAVSEKLLSSLADGTRRLLMKGLVQGDWSVIETDFVQDAIRELGHDGFYVSENDRKNLAVYEPSQLKAAYGNNGSFDDGRPEIVESTKRQTETPEFKKWFGDSKVVDAEGKPLVVYHGTNAKITEFKNSKKGARDPGFFGKGFYFTPNEDAAFNYADSAAEADGTGESAAIPVYLSLQNPFVWDMEAGDGAKATRNALASMGIQRSSVRGDSAALGDDAERRKFMAGMKAAGHDGVIVRDEDGVREVVAFNPEQIKSAIGNRGTFDPSSPSIVESSRRVFADSGRDYDADQLAAFERTGRVVKEPSLKERLQSLMQDWQKKLAQGLADQFAPIKDLGAPGQKAYALARLSKGAHGALQAFLQHGKLKLTEDGVTDADTSGGVIERLLAPLGGETADFLSWVSAQRADRLSVEDRERLFTPQDIAALKRLEEGTTKFDYTLQHGPRAGQTTRDRTLIYRDANKTFNEFQKNVLDLAEQSGLIDKETRPLWEHEFYVPFYRESEQGEFSGARLKDGLVRQKAFERLRGGTDKLKADLLDNVLQNWAHLIDASAKNRAAVATIDAAQGMSLAYQVPAGTKGSVWIMRDGHAEHYAVEDPFTLRAISALTYAGMNGPMMKFLSMPKHWLTIGVTSSPAFKIRNLVRDSISAVAQSDLSPNVLENLREGWKATARDNPTYVSMLAGGGIIKFGTMLEGNEAAKVRQLVKEANRNAAYLDSEGAIRKFIDTRMKPALEAYNELGNRGEEINRAALYKRMLEKGMSPLEANLAARDLLDFSMQGAWTSVRLLTQLVPFLNARIQGLYKLGRATGEDKMRVAAVLGAVTLLGIGLSAAFSDDDDWKKREDWDKNGNWWAKIGGVTVRIPKPFEIGAVATLAERGIEFLYDKDMTPKRYAGVVKDLLLDNLAMNPVPQALKPMIDVYANKDSFTGRQIENDAMQRLAPDYRFNGNTSMLARGLSTAGQAVASKIPGGAFLSPLQIDHLLEGYFGWLGSAVNFMPELIARQATNQPTRALPDLYKMATGGFVSDPDSATSYYVSSLYKQAKEIEQAYSTYNTLLKQGKVQDAADFFKDNRADIVRYGSIEPVKRDEGKLNEMVRMIERSTTMSASEKRERIDKLRNVEDRLARSLVASR